MWRPDRRACVPVLAALVFGCRQDMHDQPRLDTLERSTFFEDGLAAREPVEGTVARGELRDDRHLFEGRRDDGTLVDTLPFPIGAADLARGRERYDVFCAP